jgi:hypothetical protein
MASLDMVQWEIHDFVRRRGISFKASAYIMTKGTSLPNSAGDPCGQSCQRLALCSLSAQRLQRSILQVSHTFCAMYFLHLTHMAVSARNLCICICPRRCTCQK